GMPTATCITALLIVTLNAWSTLAEKREVDLLDMLRTPLILSFNRNDAFFTERSRYRDYMSRLLHMSQEQSLTS
ncbi:hypothetical protein KIN20_000905, partial [Parelaphostrongylus tenuis]